MKDKEKIRAEIEKIKVIIQSYRVKSDFSEGYFIGQESLLEHFEKFVNSMQEEPVSEDMWEESKQYALRQVFASTDAVMTEQAYLSLKLFSGFEIAVAHKDGANWQKKQMMKNAKDGVITFDYYGDNDKIYGCIAHDSFSLEELGLKDGDKVKMIIIKEDEQ